MAVRAVCCGPWLKAACGGPRYRRFTDSLASLNDAFANATRSGAETRWQHECEEGMSPLLQSGPISRQHADSSSVMAPPGSMHANGWAPAKTRIMAQTPSLAMHFTHS